MTVLADKPKKIAPKKIAIVVHQEHSRPGRVGVLLEKRGYELHRLCPNLGCDLPEDMSDYAGVVIFGGPGIMRHDPDFMAAYVVNHILGGGSSSRLYKEVREKRGLAYSVFESLLWMDHSALFVGNTGTRADRAGETIDAVAREIRKMAEDGPTQEELDVAKSYLKGSQMLALDTSSKLASALLQYQLDKLPIDYIEKRNAIVDAVTLDDAKKAAQRLWGQGLLTVIVGRAPQAAAQPAAATPPTAN